MDDSTQPSNERLKDFCRVPLVHVLQHDPRPTFVVDLQHVQPGATSDDFVIAYYNPAFREQDAYSHLTTTQDANLARDSAYTNFVSWCLQTSEEPAIIHHHYASHDWTYISLTEQFRVISARINIVLAAPENLASLVSGGPATDNVATQSFLPSPVALDQDSSFLQNKDPHSPSIDPVEKTRTYHDWTHPRRSVSMDDHRKLAQSTDWAATPLGPIEDWGWDLKAASDMTMRTPYPAAMYWGPEFTTIYNEPYIDLAGGKHPALMGKRYADGWAEIWDVVKPVLMLAWDKGTSTMKHDDRLFIYRKGFLEETYFSWSIVPLLGGSGMIMGLFNAAFESTQQMVSERRLNTLREIGERTATARTFREFWQLALKGLEFNEPDVPFCIIYSAREDVESDGNSSHSGSMGLSPLLTLEGSLGVPDGHLAAPSVLDIRAREGFAPFMRQSVLNAGTPIHLEKADESLSMDHFEGYEWRGWGDACRSLVIFAVNPVATLRDTPYANGFIVLGVNPRRPYDEDYALFIGLLSRQLATSLASVVLFEEETKRSARMARLAAMDRHELSLQLQQRTQEAAESELKFRRLAEFAPVGIFIANFDGQITYCNDMWWLISREPRPEDMKATKNTWMDGVADDDKSKLRHAWDEMLVDRTTISIEFRFRSSQRNGDDMVDTWVLMTAYPENYSGAVEGSIFGCVTDITTQKRAEQIQSERREEALELKRQQENFIDITSHEMRNPLSAILQSVDQITANISAFNKYEQPEYVKELHRDCLDAANIIGLCASHQKRIVDDILTLSKLDARLISITPVDREPLPVVEQALKMFRSEIQAHDIQLLLHIDQSFHEQQIGSVLLDPSRLQQILINLITNAIKFTQSRDRRVITVTIKAFSTVARLKEDGASYFETSLENVLKAPASDDADTDRDGRLFLHFTVHDSGSGISGEDLNLLFRRFQQATPRTHVQYGGSGLGLFISRTLVEMLGGQIGVHSREGKGSSFFFYIECWRSLPKEGIVIPRKKDVTTAQTREVLRPSTTTLKAKLVMTPALQKQKPIVPADDSEDDDKFNVLIVEDNLINQKVLQKQLINKGCRTYTANHGQEALEILKKSRFWKGNEERGHDISVILLDLEMPVMDGLTCARSIRELESSGQLVAHIPIIAVTAYARPEQIQKAQDSGMDEVMPKPFRITDLMPKIAEVIEQHNNSHIGRGRRDT